MKKNIVLFVLAMVLLCNLGFAALTVDWRVVPLAPATFGNYRHLAYNPATGHLLLINSSLPQTIYILSALDGTTIGELAPPTGGYAAGSPSPYGIGVDANGVIYATDGFYTGLPSQVLQWAAEDTVTPPTVACVVGDALWMRNLCVVGTGAGTKIVLPSSPNGTDEAVHILGTTDGITFTEEGYFLAPDCLHAAVATPAMTTIYTTRAFDGSQAPTTFTHKWDNIDGTWTEDATFTKSTSICDLAYSIRGKLYGAYWNVGTVVDGIRVWNPTTGELIDSLDLGDTGENARGGYITVYNAPNPLDDKLYFAFHGDVGYGRISIPTDPVITVGPSPTTVTIGQTKQFVYSGIPDPIVWSTTSTAVGTIDASGLFSAVGAGSCQVKATYTRGLSSWSGSADVTVIATAAPLASDVVSHSGIHRIEHVGEISVPRVTRSWELFE